MTAIKKSNAEEEEEEVWVLSGCVPTSKSTHSKPSTLLFCHEVPLNADIQSFWDLETIGIKEIEIENQSVNPVLEKFEKTIQWVDGRYSVRLPWKENAQGRLVNNKASAMKRLESLSGRLGKDADLRQKYNDYFEDMLKEGTEKGEIIHPVQRLHDLEIHSPLDSPLSCMDTSVIFAPSPLSSESLQSNTSKKDMFDSEDHHQEDFQTNTVKQTRRGRPVKPREILDL